MSEIKMGVIEITTKRRRAREAHCHMQNLNYRHYNQQEHETVSKLAEGNHPASALYTACRWYFDTLSVACNSAARLVAMTVDRKGEPLHSLEFWVPSLSLPTYCDKDLNGEYFGRIYPAHERWNAYVDAMIAAGFPGVKKELHNGQFIINNELSCESALSDEERQSAKAAFSQLQQALVELAESTGEFDVSLQSLSETRSSITVRLDRLSKIKTFKALVRVFTTAFKGSLLPKRRPDQDTKEQYVPLAERKVMLGNVSKVTDNGNTILLPLIPFNDEAQAIQLDIVNTLREKVLQGLPLSQAQPHFERILTKTAYKSLMNELSS